MSNRHELRSEFNALKKLGLKLDLTRGKPSPEQLDLADPMLQIRETHLDGIDCRNYGCLEGLPSARNLFADYLGVNPEEVIIGGNSSLTLMHDFVAQTKLRQPIRNGDSTFNPIFICPVPGYDRHFTICDLYGITMMSVGMNDSGPDMDAVERIARDSPAAIGIWCVPKHSNPDGCTYSQATVNRLAAMRTGNPNFKIYWDGAYAIHDLTDSPLPFPNLIEACKRHGNPDRAIVFGSTSKISYAGGGVAFFAASAKTREWFLDGMRAQTIGYDKMSQLRHVLFFKDMDGIRAHMAKHRNILVSKFAAVDEALRRWVTPDAATWKMPLGGYFVNLQTRKGLAKKIVALAAEAGVKLTPAGASFPGGRDSDDSNIRLAPTFPSLEEVEQAMNIVAIATQLVHLETR